MVYSSNFLHCFKINSKRKIDINIGINKKYFKFLSIFLLLTVVFFSISSVSSYQVEITPIHNINNAVNDINSGRDNNNTIILNPGKYNKSTDWTNNIKVNNSNINIIGNGLAKDVIIDGEKNASVIFGFSGSNNNITIKNITLTDSYSNVLLNSGGNNTFLIENCVFLNNHMTPVISLFGTNISLNVNNSYFENCNAGAIQNIQANSRTNVSNSVFINNNATNGAAINTYVATGFVVVNNCTFINNSASGGPSSNRGGAILCQNGSITNSTFINNTAVTNGSAISSWGYNISIIDNVFINQPSNVLHLARTGSGVINQNNVFLNYKDSSINVNNSYPVVGEGVNVSGVLRDTFANVGIGNVNVTVSASGVNYTATTGSDGSWSVVVVAPSVAGSYDVFVNWDGNSDHVASVNSTGINVSALLQNNTTNITNNTELNSVKSVISLKTIAINEGKIANIRVTLKDINGAILSGKTLYITINKKTYKATTNKKGVAIFKVSGLKGNKYKVSTVFKGDNKCNASKVSGTQHVKAKVDLSIVKIAKVKSKNKHFKVYKITIKNLGSLKSVKTTLNIQHIRKNGYKSKIKVVNVKSLNGGKKTTIVVKFYSDKNYHKFCKDDVFVLNPKRTQKEITYKNNKKVLTS